MKRLFITALLLSLASTASANMFDRCFYSMDADGDGSISAKELKNAYPKHEQEVMQKADSDNDGVLSHDEWENFKAGLGITEDH